VRVEVDLSGFSESAQLRLRTRYADVLDPPAVADAPADAAYTTAPPDTTSRPDTDTLRARSRTLLASATSATSAAGDTEPSGTRPTALADPDLDGQAVRQDVEPS
jgi:hypothetical protein